MNIGATLIMAGLLSAAPGLQITHFSNPVSGLDISAGGITLSATGDGVEAKPSESGDFEVTLRLSSGTPIRVRL